MNNEICINSYKNTTRYRFVLEKTKIFNCFSLKKEICNYINIPVFIPLE
jgi:hypothetical protein